MTKQEIFSKVWAHLEAQGRRSMNSNGTCAYRGPGGAMCAIGLFLSDEAAQKLDGRHNGNGTSVDDIFNFFPAFLPPEFIGHEVQFFMDLQAAHDQAEDYGRKYQQGWRENMVAVANRYRIEIPTA